MIENKALIISGATACGKSALALKLSDYFDVTIINADSLQIYRGLPILSAQPSESEQKAVKHFLYSELEPEESCSVGLWLKLVKQSLDESFAAKKLPIIVGGSGMYISKLFDGISEIAPTAEDIKIKVRQHYEKIGAENFKQELIKLGEDKNRVATLDKQRLIRLYEVLEQTGKSLFYWQKQSNQFICDPKIFTHINLDIDREALYQNCNQRFAWMLENGAIEEVKNLIAKKDNKSLLEDRQISKTLGFSEICDLIDGKISTAMAIEIATQKTRNYAKRQLTWFRNKITNKRVFNSSGAALEFLKNEI